MYQWGSFLWIWAGQVVSILGSNLSGFALGIWLYQTTGSASNFALVALCSVLPQLLVSPLAGGLIDRYPRRWMMALGDSGAALCTLAHGRPVSERADPTLADFPGHGLERGLRRAAGAGLRCPGGGDGVRSAPGAGQRAAAVRPGPGGDPGPGDRRRAGGGDRRSGGAAGRPGHLRGGGDARWCLVQGARGRIEDKLQSTPRHIRPRMAAVRITA